MNWTCVTGDDPCDFLHLSKFLDVLYDGCTVKVKQFIILIVCSKTHHVIVDMEWTIRFYLQISISKT